MKSHREDLTFNLPTGVGFQNIVPQIEAILQKIGLQEGLQDHRLATPLGSQSAGPPSHLT